MSAICFLAKNLKTWKPAKVVHGWLFRHWYYWSLWSF